MPLGGVSVEFIYQGESAPRDIAVQRLIIAGWTGRNKDATEKNIPELEALGVRRPSTTPIFYRVAASLLTTDDEIEVLGTRSTGEVDVSCSNPKDACGWELVLITPIVRSSRMTSPYQNKCALK
jgi:Protein of unknown function (DUF2848)